MAPLAQWAIQILGSLYAKDYLSSCGTQWQVTPQGKDNPATSPIGSIGVTGISPAANQTEVYAGPFSDGSIGYKVVHWNWWVPRTRSYYSIGGSVKGPPLAVSWTADINYIFAVGRDDRLWHNTFSRSWDWDPVNTWRDLGGNLSSNYRLAAAGSESHVDVFGVREENGGTKSLWRQSWNGSSWLPDLEQLPGSYSTAPSVTSRVSGELTLFIVDVRKNLRHRRYRYSDRQWSAWDTIGTGFRSAPAAFSISRDRFDVFGIKDDGTLYHRAWVKRWLEWENFGGTFDEIVSVERFTPDSLVLVGRKADDSYEGRFYGWNRPANESVWDSLGGAFASQPAQVNSRDGYISIFGIGLDGALLYQAFDEPRGRWYPGPRKWQTIGEGPK